MSFQGMEGGLDSECGWVWAGTVSLLGQHHPPCAGWHRGPDLEWKTSPELTLIQKSPIMPTSPSVPLQRTGFGAPAKLN